MESKPLFDLSQKIPENKFPYELLGEKPDVIDHKYSYEIKLYKSNYNPEMALLIQDYEVNVHRRELADTNFKFINELMAYSPLYDPNDIQ